MTYKSIEVAQVVAISTNRCIGKNNDLPWRLPEDLKHFKSVTMDVNAINPDITGIIIMGRKTYESMGSKALPNRRTIIITSDANYLTDNTGNNQSRIVIAHSLLDGLDKAHQIAVSAGIKTIWVVGGQRLFKDAMAYTDRIELTQVHTCIENGNAFYPRIPLDFDIVQKSVTKTDASSGQTFYFCTYLRNQNT